MKTLLSKSVRMLEVRGSYRVQAKPPLKLRLCQVKNASAAIYEIKKLSQL